MMLKDLVLKNRSYRGFDESVRISRETLEGFVDCARLCPSSVNKQPLKYFLAWEPEDVEKVQGLTKWARALPEMVLPHPGKRPTGFVVICQDKGIDENLSRYQKDVGIVAQTMLLAAVEAPSSSTSTTTCCTWTSALPAASRTVPPWSRSSAKSSASPCVWASSPPASLWWSAC